jgi:hypothetical protein
MKSAIGTAIKTDRKTPDTELLTASTTDLLNQKTGNKTTKVMNQPAPKGSGKYSVQNESGTLLENKN